ASSPLAANQRTASSNTPRSGSSRSSHVSRSGPSKSASRESASRRSASSRFTVLVRGDVLVDPEEVVRIPLPLQRLQPVVLVGTVGGADPLLALFGVREEVDVHGRVPLLERRPEVTHPLPLLVEALCVLGAGADVVGE